jgi:ribose transport system ATP-binding protein
VSSTPPLLLMRNIRKSFTGTVVLSDVRFDLQPGEIHILAGENGAGKSTLIKILCGVHVEYDGTIELEGRPVKFSSPQDAASHGITAIHQELSLVPSMSVGDNIFLGRERRGRLGCVDFASQETGGGEILSRLGVDVEIRRAVEEYPISLQQMVEIAKALSIDARIIVMDEPTSALTEPEVERLFKTIATLREQGRAIIYITHKMEEIYKIGDRITVLRDGEYIGTAAVSDLPKQELIRWMVGREISDQFPSRAPKADQERLRAEHFTVPGPHGARPLVQDVSFSVRSGEILGIAGLQGSGASELLHGLFGSFGTTLAGELFLDDRRFEVRSPRHSINHGLALLTNDRKTTGLVLGMRMPENVTLASLARYSPGYWMRNSLEVRCAERHQKELNIKAARLDMEVSELSGGNQQKVALAKWIETQPKVLLLDEPTRGIDVAAKHEIYELMNKWTSAGCAIVLITSEMPELLALSDRIMVMHRGRITLRLQRGEATQENILHAAMGMTGPHEPARGDPDDERVA